MARATRQNYVMAEKATRYPAMDDAGAMQENPYEI
jgi:hypothetical protein